MNKTTFIIPLLVETLQKLNSQVKRFSEADGFEIWLDRFEGKIPKIKKIIVLNCKDAKENGLFRGSSKEKVDRILKSGKADYIDVGIHTDVKQIRRLKKEKVKLILSFHDFKNTPSEKRLHAIIQRMKKLGADVVKIATMVNTLQDNEILITLALELKEKNIPHIVIGMGELGIVSRIFSEKMGNVLTFVAGKEKTAEGQITLAEMVYFKKIV